LTISVYKIMINRVLYLFTILLLILSSCSDKPALIESFAGFAQGTTYSVVYENNKKLSPEVLKTEVEKILVDFDMSLSLYKDSSVISRLNRNEDVVPDEYFRNVFQIDFTVQT